jgi:hypothetical protein
MDRNRELALRAVSAGSSQWSMKFELYAIRVSRPTKKKILILVKYEFGFFEKLASRVIRTQV